MHFTRANAMQFFINHTDKQVVLLFIILQIQIVIPDLSGNQCPQDLNQDEGEYLLNCIHSCPFHPDHVVEVDFLVLLAECKSEITHEIVCHFDLISKPSAYYDPEQVDHHIVEATLVVFDDITEILLSIGSMQCLLEDFKVNRLQAAFNGF